MRCLDQGWTFLASMDIDQSARRQARDEFRVIDPDYYDMEGRKHRYSSTEIDIIAFQRVRVDNEIREVLGRTVREVHS